MERNKNGLRFLIFVFFNLFIAIIFTSKTGTLAFDMLFIDSIQETKADISALKLESRYYYYQLDNESQDFYRQICYGIQNMQDNIWLRTNDYEVAYEIYQFVLMDFPEFFWADGESLCSYYKYLPCLNLKPVYNCSEIEKEIRQEEIQNYVSECLSKLPPKSNDYSKIQYIFEYLVNHTEYNKEAEDNQNIYSTFVKKQTVCAGYAKATQYLLSEAGVKCIYVFGTAKGESHAWNIVECDGQYYHVDTTWGDPVYKGEYTQTIQEHINYDYLCCSDDEIFETHCVDEDLNLPECGSDN